MILVVGCSGNEPSGEDSGGPSTGSGGEQASSGGSGNASGGAFGSGGDLTGSGGAFGTGGDPTGGGTGGDAPGSGGMVSTCTEADSTICGNQIGTHCGLTFEYWKDQGTGCLTNKSDGFSVEWDRINNLLGRKGVRPGTWDQVVNYDADYRPDGNSYLCVYGWTKSPLVEYYIVDSWGTWRPPGGEGHMGTVTSDGGTYDIYRTQRVNQPSIEGTATFYQFWSVRTTRRESGAITVRNHFAAWEDLGMNMGSLYEVSMCVEGYQSSGSADVSVFIE